MSTSLGWKEETRGTGTRGDAGMCAWSEETAGDTVAGSVMARLWDGSGRAGGGDEGHESSSYG